MANTNAITTAAADICSVGEEGVAQCGQKRARENLRRCPSWASPIIQPTDSIGFTMCDIQPPKSTQPGHPSVGRHNEYQQRVGSKQAQHAPVSMVSQFKLASG